MGLPELPDALVQVDLPTGTTVGVTDSGGEGPAVLCSHGLLMNHAMFAPQVAALRDRYRMLTWDERGHGSHDDTEPWSFWDSARDALAVLDHAGIEQAVLAGMSQGGFLSLRAALLAPERVTALVLLDTQAGVEDPEVVPLYEAMAQDWADNGTNEATLDVIASLILGPSADTDSWKAHWRALPQERATRLLHPLLARDDLTGRLDEITCPALVVHGGEDASIPMERAEALAAGLPGAGPVVVVPGAGHAANLTHPGPVNSAIERLLADL